MVERAEIVARHYRDGSAWLIVSRGASLERLEPIDSVASGTLVLAPALFDIQVNGFAGIDFNSTALKPDDMRLATRALTRFGVTRFCPTVITASPAQMCRALQTIASSVASHPDVAQAVVGVHLEGPFISRQDGPRGAHPLAWVRQIDEDLFASFQQAAAGLIRLTTLAPELLGAAEFIRHRVDDGIVVALGHTAAGEEHIRAAIDAGASLSTHLGNGCAAVLPRHTNPVTLQLGQDELAASFIADGHHLPPFLLKSFIRAKGINRSILTTDCISAAAAPPGYYRLGSLGLEVGEDRVVRTPGQINLAGSALTLDTAVTNTVAWAGVSLADAIDMASLHPGKLLKLKTEATFGLDSDLLLVDVASTFSIKAVFRAGVCVAGDVMNLARRAGRGVGPLSQ